MQLSATMKTFINYDLSSLVSEDLKKLTQSTLPRLIPYVLYQIFSLFCVYSWERFWSKLLFLLFGSLRQPKMYIGWNQLLVNFFSMQWKVVLHINKWSWPLIVCRLMSCALEFDFILLGALKVVVDNFVWWSMDALQIQRTAGSIDSNLVLYNYIWIKFGIQFVVVMWSWVWLNCWGY